MSFHVVNKDLDRDLHEEPVEIESASVTTKAVRLAVAAANWVAHGAKLVTSDEKKRREGICALCPYWKPDGNLGFGECGAPGCGCTKGKLWLDTSRCTHPQGPRW